MLSYFLKRKKRTETKKPRVAELIKGKLIILLKFAVFQSSLRIKTHLSKIPLASPLFI